MSASGSRDGKLREWKGGRDCFNGAPDDALARRVVRGDAASRAGLVAWWLGGWSVQKRVSPLHDPCPLPEPPAKPLQEVNGGVNHLEAPFGYEDEQRCSWEVR